MLYYPPHALTSTGSDFLQAPASYSLQGLQYQTANSTNTLPLSLNVVMGGRQAERTLEARARAIDLPVLKTEERTRSENFITVGTTVLLLTATNRCFKYSEVSTSVHARALSQINVEAD